MSDGSRVLRYRGHDRRGVARVANSITTPAALAESLFERGFRDARIEDNRTGELLGAVVAHPDTGRRTWWGER
ncbi:MAG: hypothetical protein ACYCQK_01830 [Acidiferrobacteraceae bacterium]